MASTTASVLSYIDDLIGDSNDELFTAQSKLDELNRSLVDMASDTGALKKEADIHLKDIATTYEFPEDMVQLRMMAMHQLRGNLVLSTTYESIVNEGSLFNQPNNLASQWHVPGTTSRGALNFTVSFRDHVSHHEFILDPVIDIDTIVPPDPNTVNFGP